MTETMRAVLLRGWDDLAVEEIPRPEPGPGEVLLRVGACGICGTDLKMVSGGFEKRGWPPSLPFVMGHEWAGEVVELGPGLEGIDLALGDRVAAENHAGCGVCPNCKAGRLQPLLPGGPDPGTASTGTPRRARSPSMPSVRRASSTGCPPRSRTRPARWMKTRARSPSTPSGAPGSTRGRRSPCSARDCSA